MFEVLPTGKIALAHDNNTFISADYDSNGNLAAFRNDARTVTFDRDAMGRVSQIHYPSGHVNQYTYDGLGNRSSVNFSSGGAVRYRHDPAGNIVEVSVTEPNGEVRRQTVQIGDMNQVDSITYEDATNLDIDYDGLGRAVSFGLGTDKVSIEYDGPDHIGRIYSRVTGESWSPTAGTADHPTIVADSRLQVLHGEFEQRTHPDYGIIAFSDISFRIVANDPTELGIPGLREARQFLAVSAPLFSSDGSSAMSNFEKPSNPVFQPLEYRSTNCCIAIPSGDWCLDGYDSAGRPTICYCGPVGSPGTGCSDPDYDTPDDALPPLISYPDLIPRSDGRYRWGLTSIKYDYSSLSCWELCNGKFRLEGEIRVASGSFIKVSTKVPPTGNCTQNNRTQGNVDRTFAHEYKHADKLLHVIDHYNGMLGTEHDDILACDEAKDELINGTALKDGFIKAFEKEETRQLNHEDHIGETRYVAICRRAGQPAEEIACGSDRNFICDVPDTYFGPRGIAIDLR